MKKLCFCFLSLCLFSCNYSVPGSLNSVMIHYPNCKIFKCDNRPFSFLVLDSNRLLMVSCLNIDNDSITDISVVEQLK